MFCYSYTRRKALVVGCDGQSSVSSIQIVCLHEVHKLHTYNLLGKMNKKRKLDLKKKNDSIIRLDIFCFDNSKQLRLVQIILSAF